MSSTRPLVPAWTAGGGRMRNGFLLVVFAVCLNLPALAAPSVEWPSVLVPDRKVSMYWIAELVVQNGIPMQIRAFDSDGLGHREMQFYREWLQTKPDFSETQIEGRPVLAARSGNFRIVAELRPPTGKVLVRPQIRITTAWLYGAVPDLVGPELDRTMSIPVPVATTRMSDTYSFDEDLVNRTTVYANTFSVESNELHIREQALRDGWTVTSRKTIKGGLQSQTVMRRNMQEAVVAISHDGSACSIVVSNTTKPR